jgi:hypothetical protein
MTKTNQQDSRQDTGTGTEKQNQGITGKNTERNQTQQSNRGNEGEHQPLPGEGRERKRTDIEDLESENPRTERKDPVSSNQKRDIQ